MTEPEREVLTWETFGDASRDLTKKIVGDGFVPDIVIAIARGGLIPAGAISYAMGVEETLPDPVVLEPLLDTDAIVGKKLLVVDDVADSGRTLALVIDLLKAHTADVRSAVIYTKPRTIVQPDYSWRETDKWINFPWSTLPVIT